jgi:spore maturation protein A
MDSVGLTDLLSGLLRPILGRLFPESRKDPELTRYLSGNMTANLLGLGNAATPMGIRAAERLRDSREPTRATDSLCRLVVLNTASIQLLPTTVAAVRRSAGCAEPFDILPAVWVSSILSVAAGLAAVHFLRRVWRG